MFKMIYRVKQYSIKDDDIRELASLTHVRYSILLLSDFFGLCCDTHVPEKPSLSSKIPNFPSGACSQRLMLCTLTYMY